MEAGTSLERPVAFGHFAVLLALLGVMVQLFALNPTAEGNAFVFSAILWTIAVIFVAMEWSALGRRP